MSVMPSCVGLLGLCGRTVAKRTLRGLYGGRQVAFGNKVSEDGGNKTRRKWKPNVQRKKLYSQVLKETFTINVTTHVLRCMRKAGGFDEYLIKTPHHKIQSDTGSRIKNKIEEALLLEENETQANP